MERYRHWLNGRVLNTPGIKFVAEQAGAYWLLDIIATHFGTKQLVQAMTRDARLKDMQFWRLDVHADRSATVSARADAGEEPYVVQEVPCTDFPLEYVDIWAGYNGLDWTLYLPSEHRWRVERQFCERRRIMLRNLQPPTVTLHCKPTRY